MSLKIVQVLLGKYIGPKELFQIPNVFPSEGTCWNRATVPMFFQSRDNPRRFGTMRDDSGQSNLG